MNRTMRIQGIGMAALTMFAVLGLAPAGAEAQVTVPGETVVYETVAPASSTVTYGERTRVRYKRHKVVIRERPTAYVTRTPPVVSATRYVQAAPIVEQRVIQPAPIVEQRVIQPAPVVEESVVQPAPVVETRVIRSTPMIQTQPYYYGPYPR